MHTLKELTLQFLVHFLYFPLANAELHFIVFFWSRACFFGPRLFFWSKAVFLVKGWFFFSQGLFFWSNVFSSIFHCKRITLSYSLFLVEGCFFWSKAGFFGRGLFFLVEGCFFWSSVFLKISHFKPRSAHQYF